MYFTCQVICQRSGFLFIKAGGRFKRFKRFVNLLQIEIDSCDAWKDMDILGVFRVDKELFFVHDEKLQKT